MGILGYKVIWSGEGVCEYCGQEREDWVHFGWTLLGGTEMCTTCWKRGVRPR